jgi:hypothetical protein
MHDLPAPKPFVYFVKKSPISLAAIIKIPPKVAEDKYQNLACDGTDRKNIYDLITTMANNGKISLLFNHKTALESIGVAIEHVHPLKFLGVIFSDPHLKACMNKIFEDPFKSAEMVLGFTPGMLRQMEKGKVYPFLPDFAREVNRPENEIRSYIQASNWDGLFHYLMGG